MKATYMNASQIIW